MNKVPIILVLLIFLSIVGVIHYRKQSYATNLAQMRANNYAQKLNGDPVVYTVIKVERVNFENKSLGLRITLQETLFKNTEMVTVYPSHNNFTMWQKLQTNQKIFLRVSQQTEDTLNPSSSTSYLIPVLVRP